MTKFPVILCTALFCLLLGCDKGLGKSDMKGVFTTDHGECVKEGDVGLKIHKSEIHIDFYCFLKLCNDMDGTIEKGGFFYMSGNDGHYIQGRIGNESASGSWFTTINENKCSGTWFAKRNTE